MQIVLIVLCVSAINDSCIAVQTTDSSLKLTWCRELADAYNNTAEVAMIGIFWHNSNNLQYVIDLQLRGVVISGLTLNTEYLLDFRVKFYKEKAAGPTFKRLATRRARTKYFSTLTKMRCFELSG